MAITFCPEGGSASYNMTHIWRQTSGVFSANLFGGTFAFFDVGATTNDAIYFGWDAADYYRGPSMASLQLSITTGIAGTGVTGVWEYFCTNIGAWVPISDSGTIIDNTVGLTATGTNRVRFGRLAFQSSYGTTVNGQRVGFVVRYRITAGTITDGGLHSSTAPKTYDGTIRITGYSQATPCKMHEVYTEMNTNYPEVGMRKLSLEGTDQSYGEAYEIPNAGFYLGANDSWLYTTNSYIKMGNGSQWYNPVIGGYWVDGLRIGDYGVLGSKICFAFTVGTNFMVSYPGITSFSGTTFTIGAYQKTLNGTLRTFTSSSGYVAFSNGSWCSINMSNLGPGYWTGSGEIKNTVIRTTGMVTYPFGPTIAIKNVSILDESTSSGGPLMLYYGTGLSKLDGLSWYIGGGYLFRVNSMGSTPAYWKFLNPSPAFPTDNSGTKKLMNITGLYNTPWNVEEYYSLDVKILNESGSPISSATVNLYDKDSALVFTTTTDANGVIVTQDVLRMNAYYSSGLVTKVYNPFTLTATKSGYETYQGELTIESKTALQVTLRKNRTIRKDIEGNIYYAVSASKGSDATLVVI